MKAMLERKVILPANANWGRMFPEGPGPMAAAEFESRCVDEDNPKELIGGWVLPMAPGDFETGESHGSLSSALLPLVRARGWRMSIDSRHRLPSPPNTVVFPDLVIHTVRRVEYLPRTKTIGRVPDFVIEVLAEGTFERDIAPNGVKFLAYQMSGVREYYYTWPDGRDASGFVLKKGVFIRLRKDADGFFKSPLLGCSLRLADAATR